MLTDIENAFLVKNLTDCYPFFSNIVLNFNCKEQNAS